MVFTANYQGMPCPAFIIKKGNHIDVYQKLILIKKTIVGCNKVRENVDMVALEHFFFV